MKKTTIALLCLLIVGVVSAILIPYRPHFVTGPHFEQNSDIPNLKNTGLKIHVFNTGFSKMSHLLVPSPAPWRPIPAFVIEHPKHGFIVFDTGLSAEVEAHGESALPIPMRWFFKSRGFPEWALDLQMQKDHLDPKSVTVVILSHFHEDHTGRVSAFKNAGIWTGATDSVVKKHLPEISQQTKQFLASENLSYFLGPAMDLFGDQTLILFKGGGHSPEDLIALVQLNEGPVILTGDSVIHWSWLNSDDIERIPTDSNKSAEIRNKIRQIVKKQAEVLIFPGHDISKIPLNRPDIIIHNTDFFKMLPDEHSDL
jgi:glyoxylase-like metal-dependent hydrolase (beta-lactamase superfamily II)